MSTPFPRDLVGYGGDPPHARWPGEARIAVNFVMNYEGRTRPKMMSLGLHLRLIGHPSRAAGLERVLDYMTGHPDVWFARRLDIARHWIATHPLTPCSSSPPTRPATSPP